MRGLVWSLALMAGLLVGANYYYGSMNGGGVTPAANESADDVMMPDAAPEPMTEPPMADPMPEPMPSDPMTDEPPADIGAPMVEPDMGDMVDPADDIGASIMEDAAEAAAEAAGDSTDTGASTPSE